MLEAQCKGMSQAGLCTVVMFRALGNQGRGCGGDKATQRKRRNIRSRHRRAEYLIPVLIKVAVSFQGRRI